MTTSTVPGVPALTCPIGRLPGFGSSPYEPIRSAMMMRALHAEVKAREEYLAFGEQHALTPLTTEFVDASLFATWRQLAGHEDPAIASRVRELDPLGALADVAAAGPTVRISIQVAAEQRATPKLSASIRRLVGARLSSPHRDGPAAADPGPRPPVTRPILLSRTLRTFALVQADIGLRMDDHEGRRCGSE